MLGEGLGLFIVGGLSEDPDSILKRKEEKKNYTHYIQKLTTDGTKE